MRSKSLHDKATAYVATPDKFRSLSRSLQDYGLRKHLDKITNGLPANAFTRVVREDDVRRDLLFAGN
jgi:hypothetical protein